MAVGRGWQQGKRWASEVMEEGEKKGESDGQVEVQVGREMLGMQVGVQLVLGEWTAASG